MHKCFYLTSIYYVGVIDDLSNTISVKKIEGG